MLIDTVTVDTGLVMAWAHWNGTYYPRYGEFTCNRGLSQVQRILLLSVLFEEVLERTRPKTVILEMVELWEGNDKSRMSAVRGDTFGLALLIGAYINVAGHYVQNISLLTAREWKGQLSKEATAYRVECINGIKYTSEHITDAVAIGFSRDYDVWHLKKR